MRFAAAGRRERQLPLDMTPMIDIVFQLLIFFLTTTQLARTAREVLALPAESGSEEARSGSGAITVNLLADGSVLLGDRAMPLADLSAALAARRLDRPGDFDEAVLIRADREAPAAALNTVVRSLRSAGAAGLRLAVDPAGAVREGAP